MNTSHDIDEIKSIIDKEPITLLYISSYNCNVCKVIFPRIESMLNQFPEVTAIRAELDELPCLPGDFNVFTIPCVLVFAEGKETIREARYINIQNIEEQIQRIYNMMF